MSYNHVTMRLHIGKTLCILIMYHIIGHPDNLWLWPRRKEFAHSAATLTACTRLRSRGASALKLVEKLGHNLEGIYCENQAPRLGIGRRKTLEWIRTMFGPASLRTGICFERVIPTMAQVWYRDMLTCRSWCLGFTALKVSYPRFDFGNPWGV